MMKKARLLITLAVMLVAASGYAQDSYREALREYLVLNGNLRHFAQESTAYKESQSRLFKSGDLDLDQLTDRYLEEGLVDFITDVNLPKIKEQGISEEDLKNINSLLSSPEGKTFVEHLWQLSLTPDDIDIAAKLFADDSPYNKLHDIINAFKPLSYGSDLLINYVEWMQAHGAVLQDNANDEINRMKKMSGK